MDAHLARALELARRGVGTTQPNPSVGAVVVAHGEVVALDRAGEAARGATLYVTMEPCTHHGRTPPCVDRIADAGIARVVAGCLDPNPEAGGGLERLRAAATARSSRSTQQVTPRAARRST